MPLTVSHIHMVIKLQVFKDKAVFSVYIFVHTKMIFYIKNTKPIVFLAEQILTGVPSEEPSQRWVDLLHSNFTCQYGN